MASRIKGITVEIGGDTTKLEAALKSVNGTIRQTQSQLKDVNKLLKLDPSNTELLSQKQKSLKDVIGATKEKLEALKTAQEQAKQQLEEGNLGQDKYDALQREIIETEQELKRLQEEALNTNQKLEKIDEVGKKMETAGDSIAGVGKKMLPATAAIAGVGTAAIKTASDFDAQMSKVSAISGATGDDFQKLRDKAREMGAKTKFSASEAGSAFEYMAMAGWKTGDMLDGIEGIMNLAAASGEDLATTSDIVTDALTAFGLTAADSGHFADILAAASSNANTNVSMMGETFKYCAPIAGALGFSAEDTAEAIGLMANAGIKSTQAGTSLRTIMNNLSGPIKIAGDKLGEVTIQTTNADGSMRSLSDILSDCRGAFSQLSESEKAQAAESLVGKNAMSGFLALMNAGQGDIDKLSNAIANCDGTSEQMAETMQDNLSGQLTILKSQLEELAISFGDILMPAIRNIVSHIQDFVDKLNGMDEGTKENIIRIGLLVAAIGPFLVILGTTISKIGVAMQGFVKLAKGVGKLHLAVSNANGIFGKLGAALGGISAPVMAAIAVLALLVGAFVHLWRTNEEFRDKMTAIWERVKSAFSGFADAISTRLEALGISFSDITGAIKKVWDGFCDLLAPVFEGAFNIIASVLEMVLNVLVGLFDVFSGLFTGNWELMWTGVKEIFSGIWEGIKGILSAALEAIKGIADTVLGWFGTNWETFWTNIKTFFTNVWNGIVSFFTGIWENIKNIVSTAINVVSTTISTVLTTISTIFSKIWNGIVSVVTRVWNTIKNVVQVGIMFIVEIIKAAFNLITLPFRFIWENCKGVLTSAWNAMKATVTTVVNAIKNVIVTVWTAVKTFMTTVLNGIKQIVTTVWNAIKSVVTTVVNAIKSVVLTVWNAMKTALSPILTGMKTAITTAWNTIKTTVTTVVNAIKSVVTTAWNAIKTAVTTVVTTIKTNVTNTWNGIKSTLSSVMNSIKSTITSIWTGIKTSVSTTVNGIKTAVSTAFNSIKSTASSIWNSIKNAITKPITAAKNTVSNMIEAMKAKFHFSWSLPHLKLPHLSISGHFSINPPSVPHFGISWYKKAMDGGMILDSPTIFGMQGNNLLGAGEAGSEAVVGTQSLMGMINGATESHDAALVAVMNAWGNRFIEMMADYFPQFANMQLVMDSGALVGEIAPAVDTELGRISVYKGRQN